MKVSFTWLHPDPSKWAVITVEVPDLEVGKDGLLNVDQRVKAYDALAAVIGEKNIDNCSIRAIVEDKDGVEYP